MPKNNNQEIDKKIIEAAKIDPDKFEQIIDCYWNRLFGFVRRISYFSLEDTEDILQEVFIKIYKNLNGYDDSFAFSTWAYQITRNVVVDEIRKKKARPATTQLEVEDIEKVFRSSADIQEEMINSDSLLKIRKIIRSLPLKYREVLTLRFLEDKDYTEIMDILRLPKGTVASLVSRGRKMVLEQAKKESII